MNMEETLTLTAWMAAPAFFGLLGLAALGSPLVALLGEIAANTKKRVFYDKYGQQTAAMGLSLLIVTIAVYVVGGFLAVNRRPQLMDSFHPMTPESMIAMGALATFVLFAAVQALTWKKLRTSKGLHISIGVVAALASAIWIALTIPAKLQLSLPGAQTANLAMAESLALPLTVMHVFLLVSAAAGLSLAFLVLRRNKDDFGRDYYTFSLNLAARWAAISMIAALLCHGWLLAVLPDAARTLTMNTPLLFVWIGAAALALTCIGVWAALARSKAPLQLKGLAFAALVFLWLAHTCNATLFFNFMTMM